MEKYISAQKVYCYKTDTISVVYNDEKEKALKIGYMTLYAKLFMSSQECDSEKNENHVMSYDKQIIGSELRSSVLESGFKYRLRT